MLPALLPGQTVKFREPRDADEASERFTVVELRGERVLVEFICDMTLCPQSVYLVEDMTPA